MPGSPRVASRARDVRRPAPPRAWAAPATTSRPLIDPDLRCGVEQRLERADDVGGVQVTLQVGVRLLRCLEAVQYLDVVVADEQLLRSRAGDRVEEGRPEAPVDAGGGRSVGGSDLQDDL